MIPDTRGGAAADGANRDPGTCYMIHFDERYRHAGHYLGWAKDLDARLAAHRAGRGARLMEVITDAGIGWHVSRTWPGGRDRERALKDRHEAPRLCPDCTAHPAPVARGRSAARPAAGPPAAPVAAPRSRPGPYASGERMARLFLARQDGRTTAEIAATHDYITGPWRQAAGRHTPAQAEEFRGYQQTVAGHLARLRQAEAEQAGPEAGA
jgi:predicted GIY-YIG superfamily endonuclease